VVQIYEYNPRLRARTPKAQEQLLEEYLDEQITTRMLSTYGAPIGFVVPDGYNAVDFYFGGIEVNPEVGCDDDLDLIVSLGEIKRSPNAQSGCLLQPGDAITVTVQWRYASWVELAPEHLRVPIHTRFYLIETA
jgi:hypothetical protein